MTVSMTSRAVPARRSQGGLIYFSEQVTERVGERVFGEAVVSLNWSLPVAEVAGHGRRITPASRTSGTEQRLDA